MSEMIKRVAEAMVARRNLPEGTYINWDTFCADARAAIVAMREPTERMKDAGECALSIAGLDNVSPTDASEAFTAMIDEALKPQPPTT